MPNSHDEFQGAYFLGLLGPHMMTLLKARTAAAVIYKTIDTVLAYLVFVLRTSFI